MIEFAGKLPLLALVSHHSITTPTSNQTQWFWLEAVFFLKKYKENKIQERIKAIISFIIISKYIFTSACKMRTKCSL